MKSFITTAQRAAVGNCPECGWVCVLTNDGTSWPLVECTCGWRGALPQLLDRRITNRMSPSDLLFQRAADRALSTATPATQITFPETTAPRSLP